MIHNTYYIVVYLLFTLNVHILPIENHCILFVSYTYSLEFHSNERSANSNISLGISNDKHFLTFFREGEKISLATQTLL